MRRPISLSIERLVLPAAMRARKDGFTAELEAALQRRLGGAPAESREDPTAARTAEAIARATGRHGE